MEQEPNLRTALEEHMETREKLELTETEKELIHIIRNSDDPELAIVKAIEIFTAFLEQP